MAEITEGDLAMHPVTGELYGAYDRLPNAQFLLKIDLDMGAATTIGQLLTDPNDLSGLAFDHSGTLYAVDQTDPVAELLVIDPSTAAVTSAIPLDRRLGSLIGFDADPRTDTFYIADGGTFGTDTLYTVDLATGALAEIGPTAADLSGLLFLLDPGEFPCDSIRFFPPSTAMLAAFQNNSCEDWSGVSQPGDDLPSAILILTSLSAANLSDASLSSADLTGADHSRKCPFA